MRERTLATTVFVLTLGTVAVFSLQPPTAEGREGVASLVTNLLHLPAYAALGLAALWLSHTLGVGRGHQPVMGVAIAVVVGALIEVLQPLVGRTAGLGDLALNAAGALIGVLAWRAVCQARRPERLA